MRHRIVGYLAATAALVALAAPAPAEAQPDPCDTATTWAERTLGAADLPLPKPWRVEMACGDNWAAGYTDEHRQVITIWPEMYQDAHQLLWIAWHELGHVYANDLDAADRAGWRELRGIPTDLPWGYEGQLTLQEWIRVPLEEWADSFVVCATGWTWAWRSELAGPPGVQECQVLQQLVGMPTQV